MNVNERIEAFECLGEFLGQFKKDPPVKKNLSINSDYFDQFNQLIKTVEQYNAWFTENNVRHAITAWADVLDRSNIMEWVNLYPELLNHKNEKKAKTIGVVTAGNVPLVGLHDMLCVLITNNRFMAKLSSKDTELLETIGQILVKINPKFDNLIIFEKEKLKGFDCIIATGSNNTARYFEYYFGKYPNIIRKNRNGIAVLTGKENEEDIKKLADDIFMYFGLGCRNVSKIYVPENYKMKHFFEAIEHYQDIIHHNKYANNYNYSRAVYLLECIEHYDNGFVLLKKEKELSSPVGVIYFDNYKSLSEVKEVINHNRLNIQCVVAGKMHDIENAIAFGDTQKPRLWDYADDVDTIRFLIDNC